MNISTSQKSIVIGLFSNLATVAVGRMVNKAIITKCEKNANPGRMNRFVKWNANIGNHPLYTSALVAGIVGVAAYALNETRKSVVPETSWISKSDDEINAAYALAYPKVVAVTHELGHFDSDAFTPIGEPAVYVECYKSRTWYETNMGIYGLAIRPIAA